MRPVAVYPLLSGAVELTMGVYKSSISISTNMTRDEVVAMLRETADYIEQHYQNIT